MRVTVIGISWILVIPRCCVDEGVRQKVVLLDVVTSLACDVWSADALAINSVAILIERAANITSALFTAIGIARAETVSVRRAGVAAPSRDVAFAVALPVEWIADRAAAHHGAAIVAVAGRAAVGIVGVK